MAQSKLWTGALLLLGLLWACGGGESSQTPRQDYDQVTDEEPSDGDGTDQDPNDDDPYVAECTEGKWDHDQDTSTSCVAWASCAAGTFVSQPGTATQNRTCSACVSGTFAASVNAGACQTWSDCTAGFYVDAEPSATTDRVCTSCPDGTYSDDINWSICQPAGACDAGAYETQPATSTTPPTCGACAAGEYCAGGAAARIACSGETWDHDSSPATSCATRTECLPGTYVTNAGDATTDRACDDCVSQEFSADSNADSCAPWATCDDETWEEVEPSPSQNRVCTNLRVCQPGERVTVDPTPTTDRECTACVDSFSTTDNADDCTAYSTCTDPLIENDAPTLISDRTCKFPTYVASVSDAGTLGNGASSASSISADGRYVAFVSSATNLVANDTNVTNDVFVHDMVTGFTTKASVHSNGTHAIGTSHYPVISADGTHVVFLSSAANLVDDDTNGFLDVFVHNLESGDTVRVSVDSDGVEANLAAATGLLGISGDGQVVAFASPATNLVAGHSYTKTDIFVHNLASHTTVQANVWTNDSQVNYNAANPSLSADGRYVVFEATGPLAAGDTDLQPDIYVRDLLNNTTTRVSIDSAGAEVTSAASSPHISADGRYVVFSSGGAFVSGDPNLSGDIFVRDIVDATTARVSISSSGAKGNGQSQYPNISGDGRYVVFQSAATNLVSNDTNGRADIFVHDRQSGTTTRVNVDNANAQATGADSTFPRIAEGGGFVVFDSAASNLVSGDNNSSKDVFVVGVVIPD